MSGLLVVVGHLLLSQQPGGMMMAANGIPTGPPNDGIMASPAEDQRVAEWVGAVFGGVMPDQPGDRPRIELRRQDHNDLRFGESCMETAIRIGEQGFAHGLGTHANSEIAVLLPAGFKTFKAAVGVDNNFDTQGRLGSVTFRVEIGGKVVWQSDVLKGGGAPVPVSVDLPADCREIVLKVDTTPDGPSNDQADWGDARVLKEDGAAVWLDDCRPPAFFLYNEAPPFSFTYGGNASCELLKTWKRESDTNQQEDRTVTVTRWTDPQSGLRVTATATAFKRYAAVEWLLEFENSGQQDTPLLEGIQALDVRLHTGNSHRAAVVHQIAGDNCIDQSFLPFDTNLEVGKSVRFAPQGGRSSNGTFPFFTLQYRDEALITAIGWTGQWAAALERAPQGATRLCAGLEKTHFVLHPGESVRSPRILLMPYHGEHGHNRFRRLMLFAYAPRLEGKPARPPFALQCFDRYSWSVPEWATEAGQLQAIAAAHELGCDAQWLDAAWFPGGFPNGVGNWFPKPAEFPNGLGPLGEACRKNGLRYVVWFEPERVAPNTQIAKEHPEWVLHDKPGQAGQPLEGRGGLYNLGDPDARRWLTDLLSKRIEEFGLDVYRNDFNMDPLAFWRANDAADATSGDRQGITEIRYVEGLYQMWDELRGRRPGLLIDNCSSGGRRIDLEMCSRSIPLWRSDTSCSPGHADWNQAQVAAISRYVPLQTACAWTPEAYDVRSTATAGAALQFAYLDKDFPKDLAKAGLAEAKENQPYWYGDFYLLAPITTAPGDWMAYQFHRADLDSGIVLVFRHEASRYTGLALSLGGLDPARQYSVAFIDDDHKATTRTLTGKELMGDWEIRLPAKKSSLLIRYRPTS